MLLQNSGPEERRKLLFIFKDYLETALCDDLNGVTPGLPKQTGPLNESCHNSLSTEAGVLVVITDHGPIHPVGGTYYHWWEVTRIAIPPGEASARLLIRRPLIHVLVVLRGELFAMNLSI
ncbi:hypothetical protein AVEN_116542-1 [Araneus ventricosus]|uniref:Uncharacterized protein n=1 Tax=Araneus ventricosus TaxID=182803 RepID=A0A4Y2U4H0_ARAVE|nr:hypothetical protein AVEN_116542-1 [Araneus ventricosus]